MAWDDTVASLEFPDDGAWVSYPHPASNSKNHRIGVTSIVFLFSRACQADI